MSTEQDEGWVTDLLAADDPGPMPDAVSDRILAALAAAGPAPAGRGPVGERRTLRGQGAGAAGAGVFASREEDPTGGGPFARRAVRPRAGRPAEDVPAGVGATSLPGRRSGADDEARADRRHLLLHRLLPVAAAMVVVAGTSAVVAGQLRGGGEQADDSGAAAVAEAAPEQGLRPNGLLATGTAYTGDELSQQAASLLAVVAAGGDRSAAALAAPQSAAASAPGGDAATAEAAAGSAARSAAGGAADAPSSGAPPSATTDPRDTSPLSSAAAFQACARTLGAAEGTLPAAVDLAVFDGTEAAVVVLPNRAGDGYEVIVTDRRCNADSERATATFTLDD